jgi:hypothetical protein
MNGDVCASRHVRFEGALIVLQNLPAFKIDILENR